MMSWLRRHHGAEGERGAALATVLVMVAVMSTLAISVMESARFSIQRTANQTQMDQSRWYLMGAEAYAVSRINNFLENNLSSAEAAAWLGQTLTLPLDQGAMQITIWDGDNCFNLNGLVQQEEGGAVVANPSGQIRFARLFEVEGIPSGMNLAASLADWLDADTAPSIGGGEDNAYGGPQAAYLPANRLMGDVGELRSVNGFDAGVVASLSRLVCSRPSASLNPVNINTIRPDQAALLSALIGRDLPLSFAERAISDRPLGGWKDVDEFLTRLQLPAGLSEETRSLLTLKSRWYVIGIRVQHIDAAETSVALIDAGSGHARLVRRVFGANPLGSLL